MLEKELRRLREEAEREIAQRKAAIEEKEEEFQRMAAEIEDLPARLEAALERGRGEVRAELEKEMDRQTALAKVERDWERRSLEQTIAHLQETNRGLEEKVQELSAELREGRKQLTAIAEKALEGASMARSLASLNQAALEQARATDKPRKE